MKFVCKDYFVSAFTVVPLAGTWIEMMVEGGIPSFSEVVPLAGTWIEIKALAGDDIGDQSFPLRGRGLKYPTGQYHEDGQ